MATFNFTYQAPAGKTYTTLTSLTGVNVVWPTSPAVDDQIGGPDTLTYGADGEVTGSAGTYLLTHRIAASGLVETKSFTISATDNTAPVLSAPTGATGGTDSVIASAVTDEGNGTFYALARIGGVAADGPTIIANGVSKLVSNAGAQSIVVPGLVSGQDYIVDCVQQDAAGNISNVVTTGTITTASTSSSGKFGFSYVPNTGMRIATLEAGFQTYDFDHWSAGEPDVGWQFKTVEANGYYRSDGSYYDSGTPGVHPLVVTDLTGLKTALTVDTENLVSLSAVTMDSLTVPTGGYYVAGNTLSFTVSYPEAITVVSGTPRLVLDIGGVTRYADYVSGSGTTDLVFEHVVQAGDADLDGIEITGYEANGAVLEDTGNDQPSYTLQGVGDLTVVFVDAVDPVGTVNSAQVSTTSPEITGTVDQDDTTIVVSPGSHQALNNADGTWTLLAGTITLVGGQNAITADFTDVAGNTSQAQGFVTVNLVSIVATVDDLVTSDQTPVITGTVSIVPATVTVTVNGLDYSIVTSSSNWSIEVTDTLPYDTYTVDVSATGPNGTTDTATGSLTVEDTIAPQILSVTAPAADVYTIDDVMSIVVQFDEPVNVTGIPFIPVAIGGETRNFYYSGGTGTDTLTFSYTVIVGDNGIGISIGALDLDGGTIADQASNNASLFYTSPAAGSVVVDTEAAVITVNDQETSNPQPLVGGLCNEDNVTLTLTVGDDTYNPIPSNGTWQQILTESLDPGIYTLTIEGVDVAGFVSTPDTAVLTVNEPILPPGPNDVNYLAQALDLLKQRLGRYTAGTVEFDEHMLDEIQAAQLRLEDGPELPWFLKERRSTFQTAAGQEYVNITNDFIRLRDEHEIPVQIYHDGQWKQIHVYTYAQMWSNTSGTGLPTAAAIDGPRLVLSPIPDKVYSLKLGYYSKEPLPQPGLVITNGWLEWAMDLLIAEAGVILAMNYLKNQEAAAMFEKQRVTAKKRLTEQNIAYEVGGVESWEITNGR